MASARTYNQIAYTTGAGTPSTLTFSSIPATYTDLQLVCAPIITAGNGDLLIQVNGDTATNYSFRFLLGQRTGVVGSLSISAAQWDLDATLAGSNATYPTIYIVDFMQFANTTPYKTILTSQSEDVSASGYASVGCGLWRSTAAINSITISLTASTFAAGSTFALYGIKAA